MSLQMLSMLSWLLPHSAAVRMLRCDAICPTRTTLLKELRQKKHQRTSCVQRMLQEREEFRGRLRQWQPMWARNSPTCAGKRWKKPSLSECPFRATDCMRSLGFGPRGAKSKGSRNWAKGRPPRPPHSRLGVPFSSRLLRLQRSAAACLHLRRAEAPAAGRAFLRSGPLRSAPSTGSGSAFFSACLACLNGAMPKLPWLFRQRAAATCGCLDRLRSDHIRSLASSGLK